MRSNFLSFLRASREIKRVLATGLLYGFEKLKTTFGISTTTPQSTTLTPLEDNFFEDWDSYFWNAFLRCIALHTSTNCEMVTVTI